VANGSERWGKRDVALFFVLGMPFALVRDVEESSGILVRWNPNGSSG
jgi:hypothetical protein